MRKTKKNSVGIVIQDIFINFALSIHPAESQQIGNKNFNKSIYTTIG